MTSKNTDNNNITHVVESIEPVAVSSDKVDDAPGKTDIDNYDFDSKILKREEVDYVIHHGRCMDGFSSAMCCWHWRNQNKLSNNETDIKFVPAFHFKDKKYPDDLKGKNVLICDFSYSKDQLLEMIKISNKLLILDHHKTAKDELEDIPDVNKVFDMSHSGAYITWRYFFRYDMYLPKMIKYVEDRDIWLNKQPMTDEFSTVMMNTDYSFQAYAKFLDDKYLSKTVFPVGKGMVTQKNKDIKDVESDIIPHFIKIKGKYYFAGHLMQKLHKSELGNHAFSVLPNLNFSVIYSHNPFSKTMSYSLRSMNDRTDVSKIAKVFGGGGHRNASGFGSDTEHWAMPCQIIDNYRLYYTMDSIYCKKQGGLNCAVINNSTHQKHLAKYLMQERVPGVQEASWFMIQSSSNDITDDALYSCAIVFSANVKEISGYVQLKKCYTQINTSKDVKTVSEFDTLQKTITTLFPSIEWQKGGLGKFKESDMF